MKSTPTVADALAGAQYRASTRTSHKTILIAGAAGKLGERILARVLGAPDYRRIYALASAPMASTEEKLTALTQTEWNFHVDDVIAVVGDDNKNAVLPARKRTEVFSSLFPGEVASLAHHAKSVGVSRFMLVTPTNVLSQPAAVYAQLANLMEAELHRIGFESLLLVRPSDHEIRQRQRGFARRLMSLVIDTATGLMVGLKHTPLSIEDTARAAVYAMQDSARGLTIIETDRLHRLLKS
ncbi:MAG: hypothetical protein JWQ21_3230 [Herminiimonas sp.]|nr:hypothetical protein [Herminiimonas sp.]